jgi:hypothetical protein
MKLTLFTIIALMINAQFALMDVIKSSQSFLSKEESEYSLRNTDHSVEGSSLTASFSFLEKKKKRKKRKS